MLSYNEFLLRNFSPDVLWEINSESVIIDEKTMLYIWGFIGYCYYYLGFQYCPRADSIAYT